MKHKLKQLLTLIMLMISLNSFSQQYEWTRTFGSKLPDVSFYSIADSLGNTYVTGAFQDTAYFNGVEEISKGMRDIFIVKYSASGNLLWYKVIGGDKEDKGASIALDNYGGIYITGDFISDSVNFGGTASNIGAQGGTYEDIFLLKLDTSGNFVWFKQYGVAGKDAGISLHIDNSDHLLLTGFFAQTVNFNLGGTGGMLHSGGYIDALVLKLTLAGDFVWASSFSGDEYVKGLYITSDNSDNVYVTGYFYGSIDCNDDGIALNTDSSNGQRDFYITKLNSNGDYIWSGSIGGTHDDRAISCIVDDLNNVYFTGFFSDTADFDMGVNEYNLITADTSDIFIFKIDSAKNLIWAKQIGGNGLDEGREIVLDRENNLLITGAFQGTVDFDPSSTVNNFSSAGPNKDFYVLKMDTAGNYIWNETFGSNGSDESFSLSIDNSNNIYISGSFSGNVDFDFTAGTDFHSSVGSTDVFLTKIHDNTVTVIKTKNNSLLQIYPNPTKDNINICLPKTISSGTITIQNITGQKVLQKSITNTKTLNINLSELKTGVYFVLLRTKDKVYTGKLLKK